MTDVMSLFDTFKDLLRNASATAVSYIESDDGKRLMKHATNLAAHTLKQTLSEVAEGRTPRLIDVAKNVLRFTDPADPSSVIQDSLIYENRMSTDRHFRERDSTEEQLVTDMNNMLVVDGLEAAYDKKQSLFIRQQNRFDLNVATAIAALRKSADEQTEDERRIVLGVRKAVVAIRDHLKATEDVTKKLATVNSVKASVDTVGDFVSAIPVLGSIIKGIIDVGTTGATIAETAIAFNGPNFNLLNSAVVEMNNAVSKEIRTVKTDLSTPVTSEECATIFDSAMTTARSHVFRINRPHYNVDDPTVKETYTESIVRRSLGQSGLHVYVPAISDSSIMLIHYLPFPKDTTHIFVIFDAHLGSLFKLVISVVDESGRVREPNHLRHEVWHEYSRARSITTTSKIKYDDRSVKDSTHNATGYGNSLAHIVYLGTGGSEALVAVRAEKLFQMQYELMHQRTTAGFRSIVADVLMGNIELESTESL